MAVNPYAARYRAARAYRGLSQAQLALKLGISNSTMKRREVDEEEWIPRPPERHAVAIACGVPAEFIEYGFDSPEAQSRTIRKLGEDAARLGNAGEGQQDSPRAPGDQDSQQDQEGDAQ